MKPINEAEFLDRMGAGVEHDLRRKESNLSMIRAENDRVSRMRDVNLEKITKDLVKASLAIEKANEALNFFGGHGDIEGMKAIFGTMRLVRQAEKDFTTKHGTSLED